MPMPRAHCARSAEVKAADYTAAEPKTAGFTAAEVNAAGFTLAEVKAAGFDGNDLHAAGARSACHPGDICDDHFRDGAMFWSACGPPALHL
jgi:ribosomal protein L13E